jgi:hypothetical protein
MDNIKLNMGIKLTYKLTHFHSTRKHIIPLPNSFASKNNKKKEKTTIPLP